MWKDYVTMVLQPSIEWIKLYWRGYLLVLLAIFAASYIIGLCITGQITYVVYDIKRRFKRLGR